MSGRPGSSGTEARVRRDRDRRGTDTGVRSRAPDRSRSGRRLLAAAAALSLAAGPVAGQQGAGGVHPGDSIHRVTVDQAVQTALRNSPALARSSADVNSAASQRTAAYGSFLPTVSADYNYRKASTGRLDPTGQAITSTSYSTGLGASLQLFDGLRRFRELEGAKSTLAAREASHREQRYQTTLDVKTAFYNAVAARERVEVERARVDRQREQLDFVRQRVKLGEATRSDSLRSRVDLNDARLALLNARNDARGAQFALAEAMGTDARVAPAAEATLEPDTLPYGRERLLAVARHQAPRVVSARRSTEAAEAGVGSARSGYFPSLSLRGGYDWQAPTFPPERRSWSIQLSGSIPLFDGLQRESNVNRAQAQASAARAQERTAELAVRSDVDDAYSQIETALSGLALAEESVELSREDLRVSQQRYRLGAATILDLQSAQIALQQAQVDVIRRQFDYQVGLARLESLLGTELEDLAPEAQGSTATDEDDR